VKIDTNVTVAYSFSESDNPLLTLEIVKQYAWGEADSSPDIIVNYPLNLTDAFNGKTIEVSVDGRLVADESCVLVPCPHCQGRKHVTDGKRVTIGNDSELRSALISPCPVCKGLGLITKSSCSPLVKQSSEVFDVVLPPAVRPGYETKILGKGGTSLKDGKFVVGDLIVTVDSVGKEEGFHLEASGNVSLSVYLSPQEVSSH
jgi:DnaJ-class molecular chaperone